MALPQIPVHLLPMRVFIETATFTMCCTVAKRRNFSTLLFSTDHANLFLFAGLGSTLSVLLRRQVVGYSLPVQHRCIVVQNRKPP